MDIEELRFILKYIPGHVVVTDDIINKIKELSDGGVSWEAAGSAIRAYVVSKSGFDFVKLESE